MAIFNKKSKLEWPDAWKKEDIPGVTGIYYLVAVDGKDEPVELVPKRPSSTDQMTNERLDAACKNFKGVVYIGKTTDPRRRFWNLIKSWRSVNKLRNLHGSRKTWNKNPSLQQRFPANKMKCCFIPLGKRPSGKHLSGETKKIHDKLWGPDDDARKTNQPTSAAVMTEETSGLEKYKKCMGYLPPLNIKSADKPKSDPDNNSHGISTADATAIDAKIEMGDPDSSEVRRIIDDAG